jgi:excisionase family DNA binding protein
MLTMNGTLEVANTESSQSVSILTAEYITPKELAQQLGKSLRTLYRWDELRIGPPRVVVGKLILYRREAVMAWLRSRERRHAR